MQDELAGLLSDGNRTAILVTNDVDEAVLLADRIVTLGGPHGGVVGSSIPVDLPRPPTRHVLSRLPAYQRIRRTLVDQLGSVRWPAAS